MSPLEWIMIGFWVVIFIITLIVELETMNLTTIWFCISAIVALLCGLFLNFNALQQIGIFVASSLGLVLLTRPLTKNMMRREAVHTNADRLVKMIAVVTKDVLPNEIGEVKVESNFWRAVNHEGISFIVGEKVIIDAIEGNKLVISKVGHASNIEVI